MRVGYLHRFITPDWEIVDHIDRNPRNCRQKNLREGKGINNLNKSHTSKSGYKGVYKMRDKWQANPLKNYLGTFNTPKEAHEAIIKWAKQLGLEELYLI